MIRRWVMRRAAARMPEGSRDYSMVIASFWVLRHWLWIDRYCNWSVARFGGERGSGPWWDRVLGRLVAWCDDWRLAVAMWHCRSEAERLLRERRTP